MSRTVTLQIVCPAKPRDIERAITEALAGLVVFPKTDDELLPGESMEGEWIDVLDVTIGRQKRGE